MCATKEQQPPPPNRAAGPRSRELGLVPQELPLPIDFVFSLLLNQPSLERDFSFPEYPCREEFREHSALARPWGAGGTISGSCFLGSVSITSPFLCYPWGSIRLLRLTFLTQCGACSPAAWSDAQSIDVGQGTGVSRFSTCETKLMA